MNILFISDENLLKPVVYDIHMLAESLSLNGHHVYVIGFQRGKDGCLKTEERSMSRVYSDSKAHLVNVGFVNIPIVGSIFGFFSGRKVIRKVIMEKNIDVIVLYSVICTGLPAVCLSKEFNIPLVFRHIDMLHRLMPTSVKQKTVKILEQKVYPESDMILTLTPKYAEYLVAHGADKSKIRQLPFPIDTNLFSSDIDTSAIYQKWNIDKKDRVIVFMGNLYYFSGLSDFVYEFPEVIRQVPDAKLLIVGDGNLRPKLEKIILELGLEKHVIITGWQPFQTMPQYINLASVCINPYPVSGSMKDLFSAKVIQYLACGKATVSSSLPGMKTILPDESYGVVYADNAVDMTKEVVLLLKSPEKRERLEKAGVNYVRQTHNHNEIAYKLEQFLDEAVQGKNKILVEV